jgi:hypothetical protein
VANETLHVVQSFSVNEFGEYGADQPKAFKSSPEALRAAAKAHETGKPVVAFSRTGDPKVGEYGEPQVIAKLGEIPDDVLEAFCGEAA